MKRILFLLSVMLLLSATDIQARYDPEKQPGTLLDGLNAVPECPDYFEWNGWYYLVFGQGLDTYYVKSQSPYGPWQWPETQALKEQWVNVAKTATFASDRRIVAGWIASRSDGRDSGGGVFGGSVVLREAYQLPNGDLATKFPEEVIPQAEAGLAIRIKRAEVAFTYSWGLNHHRLYDEAFSRQNKLNVNLSYVIDRER